MEGGPPTEVEDGLARPPGPESLTHWERIEDLNWPKAYFLYRTRRANVVQGTTCRTGSELSLPGFIGSQKTNKFILTSNDISKQP